MENKTFEQILVAEEYRRRFYEILDYKTGQRLDEQLVPANLNDLNVAMKQDKELYTFLNTPAKDLPDNYKYLVDEITSDIENKTLLDLISVSLTLGGMRGRIKSFFSKVGNKISGFVGYQVNNTNTEVLEIKMFSFDPSRGGGSALVWDLHKLFQKLTQEYSKVSWAAMSNNPANAIYKKAIEHYGGRCNEMDGEIHYTIERPVSSQQQI